MARGGWNPGGETIGRALGAMPNVSPREREAASTAHNRMQVNDLTEQLAQAIYVACRDGTPGIIETILRALGAALVYTKDLPGYSPIAKALIKAARVAAEYKR